MKLFLTLLFLSISLGKDAYASLKIEITRGIVNPEPISIIPFESDHKGVSSIVTNDLKNSGFFHIVSAKEHLTSAKLPTYSKWQGCNFVLTGHCISDNSIKIYLHEIVTKKVLLETTIDSNDTRRLAHKIADAVYSRVTGESGVFDSQIVFVQKTTPKGSKSPKSRIMIMDQDGANLRALTSGASLDIMTRYSNDGSNIAFLSYNGNKSAEVKLLNLKRENINSLGHFAGMTYAPNFSNDSKWIVMSMTDKKKGTSAIYKKNLETNQLLQLTKQECIDTSPCFSPDGSKIVFTSNRGGVEALYIMDADGNNVRKISFGPMAKYSQPSWSPRGDLIAFSKQVKDGFYIGVMSGNGTGERMIATGYLVEAPQWSPNGRYILYQKEERGSDPRLFIVDVTGRFTRSFSMLRASGGSWSPLRQ